MSVDEFGIPEQMFGPVPEDEYRLVGRVVSLAALIEVNLYDLLTELEQVPQSVYAGEPVGSLLLKVEGYVEPTKFEADYVFRTGGVLARLRKAFSLRNAVVHGVRPAQAQGAGLAWRPVREKHREDPRQPIVSVQFTLADLASLVRELVDLQAALADLRVRSYVARLPRA